MNTENLFETVDARYGRMTLFANDTGAVSHSLRTYGEWAENELGFMKALIPLGATVVDAGAYIGTHTLAFAHFVGSEGKVISIEPQDETFALLRRNVAANGLANVQLKHAAAANYIGILSIPFIDITEKESFGSAALHRSDVPQVGTPNEHTQEGENLVSVKVLTIDSLELSSCALMKLDVEGFEDLAIAGAEQTIKRLSPIVYAECNSVANGLRTFEIMRNFGYEVRMHVVGAFNENNFRGVPENIFGSSRETALVGARASRIACLDQRQPRQGELILNVKSADDLVLGMLNKPQYTCEVLVVSPASRSGGDGWIKETKSVRDQRDEARQIAHQARQQAQQAQQDAQQAQLEQQQARREAAASHAQMEAAMLQARLAREAADQAEANLARAGTRTAELERVLSAMQASCSWRVTEPLRAIGRVCRNLGKATKRS